MQLWNRFPRNTESKYYNGTIHRIIMGIRQSCIVGYFSACPTSILTMFFWPPFLAWWWNGRNVDTDGDGLVDVIDNDDDNDGIVDKVRYHCSNSYPSFQFNNIPTRQFTLEYPEILHTLYHICYHWLSVSGISKIMHCGILLNMPNSYPFLFCIKLN